MNWRKLLYPFSLPYGAITSIRNWAFDKNILHSQEFETPLISVGNLSAGGTGKTPMVEFLIRRFSDYKIGLVSRGYGRKTKGLILADLNHSYLDIGDEPYQIFHKFPQINLALAEKRPEGITALIDQYHPDLVILDDAYQHRHVKPGFQILLTTFQDPFYKDLLLPAGNLRENINGQKRADVIVITKCPAGLTQSQAHEIHKRLDTNNQPVYFTSISYEEPINANGDFLNHNTSIIALSGIARPETFIKQIEQTFTLEDHLKFPDHHNFSSSDIQQIKELVKNDGKTILTTEKDWVRLKNLLSNEVLSSVYYLPMQVQFLFDKEHDFLQKVKGFIENF